MPSVLVLIAKYICPFNINLFLLLNKFVLSKFICQNFKTYLSKFEKYICANCYGMVKIANNTNFLTSSQAPKLRLTYLLTDGGVV